MTSDLLLTLYSSNDWRDFAVIFVSLSAAYIIFGIAGFGAAPISAPVLAHWLPMASVVPLLALLDFIAAATNGIKLKANIDVGELAWLTPLMAVGSVVGIMLLMSLPSGLAAGALGVFAVGYGFYGLLPHRNQARIGRGWVIPVGLFGGTSKRTFW